MTQQMISCDYYSLKNDSYLRYRVSEVFSPKILISKIFTVDSKTSSWKFFIARFPTSNWIYEMSLVPAPVYTQLSVFGSIGPSRGTRAVHVCVQRSIIESQIWIHHARLPRAIISRVRWLTSFDHSAPHNHIKLIKASCKYFSYRNWQNGFETKNISLVEMRDTFALK